MERCDKQGFSMKQGVLTSGCAQLLMHQGTPWFHGCGRHEQTRSLNPLREKTIKQLHCNYSHYLEELLRNEKERSYAKKNVVLWTAIVVAYAICRYLEGVRGLFEIRPELAVAEHDIALVTMVRNVPQACVSIKQGKWQTNKYVGVSLVGKTPAVMDFGKVESEFARGSVIDKDAMVRALDNVVASMVGLDCISGHDINSDAIGAMKHVETVN
ncbi:hypothetical protein SUGI_1089240 [Cryptomeria japonica]|nr:hypothetical protein SUGI_1089240 [Cryptomeria japonica]